MITIIATWLSFGNDHGRDYKTVGNWKRTAVSCVKSNTLMYSVSHMVFISIIKYPNQSIEGQRHV